MLKPNSILVKVVAQGSWLRFYLGIGMCHIHDNSSCKFSLQVSYSIIPTVACYYVSGIITSLPISHVIALRNNYRFVTCMQINLHTIKGQNLALLLLHERI